MKIICVGGNWEEMTSTNPSICIPRTSIYVDEQLVRNILSRYKLGPIKSVDIITDIPTTSKRIFVHFKFWYMNSATGREVRRRLETNEKINIIYDFPWYWKCHMYKPAKYVFKKDNLSI